MTPQDEQWKDKAWGKTRGLDSWSKGRVYQALSHPQGYSSRHYHPEESNTFFVLAGQLEVEVWHADVAATPNGLPDLTYTLGPNESVTVNSRVWHRFIALTTVDMIETYLSDPADRESSMPNIIRFDEGGIGIPPYGTPHDNDPQQH